MQNTSTFNKIYDILSASSEHSYDIRELAKRIYGRYDSFVYFKRDNDGKVRQYPCGLSSIRYNIRICIKLGLLKSESNSIPTDLGNDALDVNRFDLVLQQAINDFLRKNNLPIEKIVEAIDNLIIPDTYSLCQYISPGLSVNIFRTCLFLLSQCGESKGQNILKTFRKKLYLTDKKIGDHQKILKNRGKNL